mgnify:CR=1 FL=1
MGFITNKEDVSQSTFQEREDVEEWVHAFANEQGWDLSDVRNRAIMRCSIKKASWMTRMLMITQKMRFGCNGK